MIGVEVAVRRKGCVQEGRGKCPWGQEAGTSEGSWRGRLLTWQCGAQEPRNLCLPQAVGDLGSRNGASLIQTFLLSLSETSPR